MVSHCGRLARFLLQLLFDPNGAQSWVVLLLHQAGVGDQGTERVVTGTARAVV